MPSLFTQFEQSRRIASKPSYRFIELSYARCIALLFSKIISVSGLTLIEKWLDYEKIWSPIHQVIGPVLCVGVVLKQEGSQDEFGRARTAE